MHFVLIDYGADNQFWEHGISIGNKIVEFKKQEKERYELFLSNMECLKWFKLFLDNKKKWPHPNSIMKKLLELDGKVTFDWMSELNMLGLYTDKEEVLSYLKEHHKSIVTVNNKKLSKI